MHTVHPLYFECAAHALADNRDTYTVATKFGNVFDLKTGDVTVFASLNHLFAGPRPMNVARPASASAMPCQKGAADITVSPRPLIEAQSAVVAAGTNALRGDPEYVK